MTANTACIHLDRYLELLKIEQQVSELSKLLADTIEPLAEYKNMCLFFNYNKEAESAYKSYVEFELATGNLDGVVAKPSTDCLAANTKLTWGEVVKMAEEIKAEMAE